MTDKNHGTIDETQRQFSPHERAIADYLADEGKHIIALAEIGAGRHPDALVDGVEMEFKTLDMGADSNTIKQAVNDSLRRTGQARIIIVDARQSGLTNEEATRALNRVTGIHRGKLDELRIIGVGFDVVRTYPEGDL